MRKDKLEVGMRVWFDSTEGIRILGPVVLVGDDCVFVSDEDTCETHTVQFSWLHPLVKKKREPLISVTEEDLFLACARCGDASLGSLHTRGRLHEELKALSDQRRAKRKEVKR